MEKNEATHKYRPTRQGTCDICGRSKRTGTHGYKTGSIVKAPVK